MEDVSYLRAMWYTIYHWRAMRDEMIKCALWRMQIGQRQKGESSIHNTSFMKNMIQRLIQNASDGYGDR